MDLHSYWWIGAGVLFIAEMMTGTFYLMLIAIAFALAGASAWLGWNLEAQLILAALCSVVGSMVLKKIRGPLNLNAAKSDTELDVGNMLMVEQWGNEGLPPHQAKVSYRGALWTAQCLDAQPSPGVHSIEKLNGNTLLLRKTAS